VIQIDAFVYLLTALLLLILPSRWFFAAVLSALIHELSHLAVLLLFGGRIRRICISTRGCEICADPMSSHGSFLSVMAGPVGSLSILLVSAIFPRLALCGLFQGVYNLIPVFPLDGGRMMRMVLFRICPQQAEAVENAVFCAVCIAVLLLSIWLKAVLDAGWILFFAAVAWIMAAVRRKIPCKPAQIGVQ